MKSTIFTAAIALAMSAAFAQTASAAVIEDFETGAWGAAWTSLGSANVNAASAHDGSFGAADRTDWHYRTDVTFGDGSVLSAWERAGNGRTYLGFGADVGGASSFVLAPNTGDIRFQNNDSYGFANLNTQSFGFTTGDWYFVTVSDVAGTITGRVYGSDGVTLLASLVGSGLDHGSGGVALRMFGGPDAAADTIGLSAVPEPATWALMLLGFGGLGLATRRRRAAAAI